jgi:signal transduction histidine kinase/ligand-binding sensor domain-containing protein/CheY-like chemotaxis protein/AraC-like DNA-binding protein
MYQTKKCEDKLSLCLNIFVSLQSTYIVTTVIFYLSTYHNVVRITRPLLFILIFLILSIVQGKSASTLPYRYVSTVQTSLSDETRCLFFTSQGLMCIGTNSGLKIFDGYSFHSYKSTPSYPNLLPNNTVKAMTEDRNNNLWLGTRDGVTRINLKTGEHRNYLASTKWGREVNALYTDRRGKVWVGGSAGLLYYDAKRDKLVPYNNGRRRTIDSKGNTSPLDISGLMSITEDHKGNLFVGTWNKGLFRIDPVSGRIYKYADVLPRSSAYSLFFDRKGRLWVGTWGAGLVRLDHPYNLSNPSPHFFSGGAGSFGTYYKVIEDPVSHTIWAANREGVTIFSNGGDLQQAHHYSQAKGAPDQQLRFCNDLYTDGLGNIWMETLNNGIVHVNTTSLPFSTWDFRQAGYTLPVTSVVALFTDHPDELWCAMKPYGIARINPLTGQVQFNQQIPGFASLPEEFMHTSVTAFARRFNGELWMANNSYGIGVYRAGKGAEQKINTNTPYIISNYVNTLYQGSGRVMWIGQQSGVSLAMPDNSGRKLTMRRGKDDFSRCDVRNIMQDHEGRTWISTENEGIIRVEGNPMRPSTLNYHHYCPKNHNYIVHDATAVFQDSHHRLWAISNSGGLFLYDKRNDCFNPVNEKYDIPGDRIFAINEDRNGRLWLTTDNALLCFSPEKDPSIIAIGEDDGLSNLLFYPNATCKSGNLLFFARQTGIFYFNPTKLLLRRQTIPGRLVVTNVLIDDKPLTTLDSTERQIFSSTLPLYTREITLPARYHKLAVEYALLTYSNIDLIKYACRLEGYDSEWHYQDSPTHQATYSNLPPGTYTLHLKAAAGSGVWVPLPYTITVRILPPWYATTWAYICYVLLLIALIYALVRWYGIHLRTENKLRMAVVFTNLTHELLTPLSVISASVDELRGKAPQYEDNYSPIQNNITRLTRLLRQILEVRKSQAGQLKLLVKRSDLSSFVNNECETLRPLTDARQIKLNVLLPENNVMGWFDADKLDKIIYNLISNAAKYSRPKGTINVSLSLSGSRATITVSDNGIGISKEKQKRLFSRFFDGDYRRMNAMGTGIGLSLTRELVTLHHGTIECESEEGHGTTFTVTIPIEKSAYGEDEIQKRVQNVTEENETETVNDESDIVSENKSLQTDMEGKEEESGNRHTLLVVDNNMEMLHILKRILGKHYRVITAKNGLQAWNAIHRQQLDLVVSDVMMPVMDGLELTSKIKQDPYYSSLPVMLITAKPEEEFHDEALKVGADDFLTKPVRMDVLLLRIQNLISNKERMMKQWGRTSADDIEEPQHNTNPDAIFLQKARDCVERHIDDSDFSREVFAQEMCVSSSTLYNKLHELTGKGIVDFINSIRLEKAIEIFRKQPDIHITDLSSMVGFNTPKYFSRCFKKVYGMSIKEYCEKLSEEAE